MSNGKKSIDKKKLAKFLKEFIPACAYSLTAIILGLRKGDDGRANALKPFSPFAAQIEFWFELAVANKEIYDVVGPEIRAMLIAALITAIKETIGAALKGATK